MSDPYRPPETPLARSRETPPLWESFVTWGVVIVSILLGLLWWLVLAIYAMETLANDIHVWDLRRRYFWMAGVVFNLSLLAGIALSMSRGFALVLYGCFVLGMLVLAVERGMAEPLLVIAAIGSAFAVWAYVLKRRGRFRRSPE